MLFSPHVKSKRCDDSKRIVQPFPTCEDGLELHSGIFTGISVEVCSEDAISAIFNNGFYGKGSQSRSVPSSLIRSPDRNQCNDSSALKESLSLGLEEAFYLSFCQKVLKISDMRGEHLQWRQFLQECLLVNDRFLESLAAYMYLKSKGWVVKSGMKFGGEFLIYRKGPRYFHASFVVAVVTPTNCDHLISSNLKCFQRIAETSHKDVLILEVIKPTGFHLEAMEELTLLKVSESIIRRFNYTAFVQHQINAT